MKDANKTTLRLTALLICLLVVTGCSDGEIVETEATVIKVIPTDGLKGCWGGPNFSTTLKMDDGHVDTICAYVGEPGEKIKGYWGSGHWDGTKNGFKLRD